jgi:hypothetical protein
VKNPVSIDFVAFNLNLSWVTARALLFTLALEGKLKCMKTSKSWVFWLEHAKELQTDNGTREVIRAVVKEFPSKEGVCE